MKYCFKCDKPAKSDSQTVCTTCGSLLQTVENRPNSHSIHTNPIISDDSPMRWFNFLVKRYLPIRSLIILILGIGFIIGSYYSISTTPITVALLNNTVENFSFKPSDKGIADTVKQYKDYIVDSPVQDEIEDNSNLFVAISSAWDLGCYAKNRTANSVTNDIYSALIERILINNYYTLKEIYLNDNPFEKYIASFVFYLPHTINIDKYQFVNRYTETIIDSQAMYEIFGYSLKVWNILFGLVLIASSILCILTRKKLLQYQKGSTKSLIIVFLSSLAAGLIYSIGAAFITGVSVIGALLISTLKSFAAIVFILLNYLYFKKRKNLFCN